MKDSLHTSHPPLVMHVSLTFTFYILRVCLMLLVTSFCLFPWHTEQDSEE